MSDTPASADLYPWEQLSMLHPDTMKLVVTVHVTRGDPGIQVGWQLREGTRAELVGLQVAHYSYDGPYLDECIGELKRLVRGMTDRVEPFL